MMQSFLLSLYWYKYAFAVPEQLQLVSEMSLETVFRAYQLLGPDLSLHPPSVGWEHP